MLKITDDNTSTCTHTYEHTCKKLPWLELMKWVESKLLSPLLKCIHWEEILTVTHLTRGEYPEYIEYSKNQRPTGKKIIDCEMN